MQKHPEIMFRLQVVEFALKHSVKLAVEAFGVSKSTIYRWIKNYKDSNNNPASLKNRYVSKKMLHYMLWYNTERPHHSLNKKSPLQYFCDIMNSNKSEFSQTGITYTNTCNNFNFML
jgi:transposase-like protein